MSVDLAKLEGELVQEGQVIMGFLKWLGMFYPPANRWIAQIQKFIDAIPVVAKQQDLPPDAALQAAGDHVTPGAPNAPALS